MNDLLDLLEAMKQHAEAERQAIRALDARRLFELANEGERLAAKLAQRLQHTPKSDAAEPAWADVRKAAAHVRAVARTNAELLSRSLQLIRAVRAPHQPPARGFSPRGPDVADEPAFVSEVA